MGLLDRLKGKIDLPSFQACAFGKLPCHKEYFFVSVHPVFNELKARFDHGMEELIRSGRPRPYVRPDRRFFVKTGDRLDLAGGVWESDDGKRGYPFMMAAPLPARTWSQPFPIFWQTLERLWSYLEAYFEDLRRQDQPAAVYNRVRGVLHDLPAFKPDPWPESEADPWAANVAAELAGGGAALVLPHGDAEAERNLLLSLRPAVNPAWILWPAADWRRRETADATARLGSRGLSDFQAADFPPSETKAEASAPPSPNPAPIPAAADDRGSPAPDRPTPQNP